MCVHACVYTPSWQTSHFWRNALVSLSGLGAGPGLISSVSACRCLVQFDAKGVLKVLTNLHSNTRTDDQELEGQVQLDSSVWCEHKRKHTHMHMHHAHAPTNARATRAYTNSQMRTHARRSNHDRDVLLEYLGSYIGEFSDEGRKMLSRLDLFETEDGTYVSLEGVCYRDRVQIIIR